MIKMSPELKYWVPVWFLTILSLLLLHSGIDKSGDPEGVIFLSAAGSGLTAAIAPFWLLYRGRIPLIVVVGLIVLWVGASLQVDAIACDIAGIPKTRWWEFTDCLWFAVPGLIYVGLRLRALKNQSFEA
ncbi:MAG TPA: hypothetical protein VGK19_00380 [Capsulimonadaceae bacterium]|jgi:hypothetical protein